MKLLHISDRVVFLVIKIEARAAHSRMAKITTVYEENWLLLYNKRNNPRRRKVNPTKRFCCFADRPP